MLNKKKIILKITIVLNILVMIALTAIPNASMATYIFNPSDYEKYISKAEVSDADKLKQIGNNVIAPIRTVASIISVAVLIILGIKYMMGSVEEKAEYKKTMLPYVIGAAMVFGITNILGIIVEIAGNF